MRQEKRSRIVRAAACAAAAMAGLGYGVSADAQFTWDGGGADTDWRTAENWTANSGFPTSDDNVIWDTSSPNPSLVSLSQDEAASNMTVTGGDVIFDLNGFALTMHGTGTYAINASASENALVEFRGPGSVDLTAGQLRLHFGSGSHVDRVGAVAASGGATVNTGAFSLGDYQGGGHLLVTGPGTVWNSSGAVQTNRGGAASPPTPRTRIEVLDGGVLNHDGTNSTFNFRGNASHAVEFTVDGAGSQFNFNVNSEVDRQNWGGGDRVITLNVTNGGLMNFATSLPSKFDNTGTGTVTYNIFGDGSMVTAGRGSIGGWSTDNTTTSRIGATIVNVGEGAVFETRNTPDGSNRSIAVFNTSTLSLQGGTVRMVNDASGGQLVLRQLATAGSAQLEGHGTITGGSNLLVEGSSIISPGLPGDPTGTISVQTGNLTAGSADAQLLFDLSTGDGSHDRIELLGEGSVANIAGVLTYNNLDAAMSDFGIMDFLIAGAINYNTADEAVSLGDIPLNTDNLDSIMSSAGYTRVFDTPTTSGEYRYFIADGAVGDLSALRLQVVPEPATLGLLGLGGLLLLRRRSA